jgi:energy-coupling factor transport system permease protein
MDLLRSLPVGLYLEEPITWLHRLDPRVKLFWLMGLLLSPILANSPWRIALVVILLGLTRIAKVPWRIWKRQMGWWTTLAILVLIITAISPDGLPIAPQPRRPIQGWIEPLPSGITQSATASETGDITADRPAHNSATHNSATSGEAANGEASLGIAQPTIVPAPLPLAWFQSYHYLLIHQGKLKITRRSLDLGIRISTLVFILVYSANLYLLTTAPEEITMGLENLLAPLRRFRWPITEITLTLTLALRFIPLVMEEFQNLVRSISTRAIHWKKIGFWPSLKIWLLVAERLLLNILLRAEQIAGAMKVRGFTHPNHHQVQWHHLQLQRRDKIAIVSLCGLWVARLSWGRLN